MKTLQALTLTVSALLLPVLAQADKPAAGGIARVAYGKDEARLPQLPGFPAEASQESIDKGIYYATFFKSGEDFNKWTNMVVVSVYPGVPPKYDIPPARTVLDFQMQESRKNCPPENFAGAVDPEENGRYGLMTSCKFRQDGKVTMVYEYTVTLLGNGQVFSVSRLGRLSGPEAAVKLPTDVIAAWKADLRKVAICPRIGGCVATPDKK
jgi:hypothetical protein